MPTVTETMLCPHTRKIQHSSRSAAKRTLKAMRGQLGGLATLHPYKCTHCDAWHLGRGWQ